MSATAAKPRFRITAILTVILAGCSGHARVTLVPMNTRQLTPKVPLEFNFPAQKCYWWTTSDGNLILALHYHNLSLAGDWTRDSFELSLLCDGPPPDTDHQYSATRDTVRGLWHRSAYHLRMRTRNGVIALRRQSDDVLSGRFRLLCTSEAFGVLTGWERQSQVLLQGEFTAVRNESRGRPVLERTEADHPRGRPQANITIPPSTQPAD